MEKNPQKIIKKHKPEIIPPSPTINKSHSPKNFSLPAFPKTKNFSHCFLYSGKEFDQTHCYWNSKERKVVKVHPCGEIQKKNTYTGIYIDNLPFLSMIPYDAEIQELTVCTICNPTIFISPSKNSFMKWNADGIASIFAIKDSTSNVIVSY